MMGSQCGFGTDVTTGSQGFGSVLRTGLLEKRCGLALRMEGIPLQRLG